MISNVLLFVGLSQIGILSMNSFIRNLSPGADEVPFMPSDWANLSLTIALGALSFLGSATARYLGW